MERSKDENKLLSQILLYVRKIYYISNIKQTTYMNKCKCGIMIPEGRINLGYITCVNCSTTEQYGCVAISNHKTGNTIQVVSKQVADNINRLASRKGYGVMSGMKYS